jgi:hypothetical protein
MEISPVGPSLRWSTFEGTLRQRREEVLRSSLDNAKAEDAKMEDAKRVSGGTLSERERIERRKAS